MATPSRHAFLCDPGTEDHRAEPRCAEPGCGLPRANARHKLIPTDNAAAAFDARKLGETYEENE